MLLALAALSATVLLLAGAARSVWPVFGAAHDPLVYYRVDRGDLAITVTERGSLESRRVTEIKCEVENLGFEQTGNTGTQILYIVPNGKAVEKEELLVELDTTALRDRVDSQTLAYEEAKAAQIQANAKYENQKTQNETALAEAELQVRLAEIEQKMYDDGTDGTYQIALQELDLKIQEARNQIGDAQAALAMRATERDGVALLFKLGYRAKADLDQAAYRYLQAEDALVRATNTLATMRSQRRKLQHYEYPAQKLKLDGALNTAKRALEQVRRDNESLLAQAEAAKIAADRTLQKEQEKLDKYQAQLEKCRIFAPHAGMVAYADSPMQTIERGAYVNQWQTILTLPDLTSMQVQTAIHASDLAHVRAGLLATIKIEAFPDHVYRGIVDSVAVLPKKKLFTLQSEVKLYDATVTIEDSVEHLHPGMNASVEIDVERRESVLLVPVQALMQAGKDTWCYVNTADGPQRRTVAVGATDGKFVEIRDGLVKGEQIVVNALDVLEEAPPSESSKPETS